MKILLFLFSFIRMALAQSDSMEIYLGKLDPDLKISMIVADKTGKTLFARGEHDVVPAASVIKIPVLIELLQQVDEKRIRWRDICKLRESDRVGGSGDLQYEAAGEKFTVNTLALKMIAVSDNVATNMLIDRLGLHEVNEGLENFGFKDTRLNRKMMDMDAVLQGRQNYTTAFEVNKMLWGLLTGKILRPKSSKKAIEFLLKCEDVTTIPRKLPKTIPVAHKSGTLDQLRGDAGIIFSEEPLVITVFVQNFQSFEQAEKIIGEIAEIAWKSWGKVNPS